MHKPAATVVQGGLVKTTAAFRPAPSLMYLPGLTARPFHDPAAFPWVTALRDNVPAIRGEWLALRADPDFESDYVVGATEHTLHTGGDWQWASLVAKGKLQASFASKCPVTADLVTSIPGLMTDVPFAYCFFSCLPGGARIKPHCGPSNLRLRCHVPLIAPDGCHLRVADETRRFTEGQPLVFDDSYEHEVWSDASSNRVVLLLDVWHPDLTPGEIDAIKGMFDEARQSGWLNS